jgi:glycosyltransferase involved in cell wall biosynthesis
MRVAIIVNSLQMGGMERVAVNLCDAFYDQGDEVHLVYLKEKNIALKPRESAIPIHSFNLKRAFMLCLIGLVWSFFCRIVNVFIRRSLPFTMGLWESFIFKKKLSMLEQEFGTFDLFIFRGQGTFEHCYLVKDKRFVYVCENVQLKQRYGFFSKLFFNLLYKNRNVVCVSDGALNSFLNMAERHKIVFKKAIKISNPNDQAQIKKDSCAITEETHPNPYVLGLGRLEPVKNFLLLIEAYAFARLKFGLKLDLVIVGSGSEENNLRNKVFELSLQEFVSFKGQQNNPFPWYLGAELFVLSSKAEGLGMVLLESLACDTMVVSTDSKGGVQEIMQGKLSPYLSKETPESLATVIMKGLNEKNNVELNEYIQETLARFSGPNIVTQYKKHFLQH